MSLVTKAFKYREDGSQVTVLATQMAKINIDSIEVITTDFVEETAILLVKLDETLEAHDSPGDWAGQSALAIREVHKYIIANWDKLSHNDMLLVERVIQISVDDWSSTYEKLS